MDAVSGVPMQLTFTVNGEEVVAEVLERKGSLLRLMLHGQEYRFTGKRGADGQLVLDREIAPGVWRRVTGAAWTQKGVRHVQLGGHDFAVADGSQGAGSASAAVPLAPRAPMPGLVRQVLVKKGDTVSAGQPLVVLEAMKLQLTLPAGADAVVDAVLVAEGDMVGDNAELVKLTALA